MRAWIREIDEDRDVHFHGTSGEDLDKVIQWCAEQTDPVGANFKHAARVDGAVIMGWCNKRGIEWGRFFREEPLQTAFLNDPDTAPFRIWKGRV